MHIQLTLEAVEPYGVTVRVPISQLAEIAPVAILTSVAEGGPMEKMALFQQGHSMEGYLA